MTTHCAHGFLDAICRECSDPLDVTPPRPRRRLRLVGRYPRPRRGPDPRHRHWEVDFVSETLDALLDPENAPAVHGSWRSVGWSMGVRSVELVDDDGCSLWVEPWEVAELVNRAVAALATPPVPAGAWWPGEHPGCDVDTPHGHKAPAPAGDERERLAALLHNMQLECIAEMTWDRPCTPADHDSDAAIILAAGFRAGVSTGDERLREAARMLAYLWDAETVNGTAVRDLFYDDDPLTEDVPRIIAALNETPR